jgi:hypothetical protein
MIRKGTSELFPQTASRAPGVALVPAIDEDWRDDAARRVLPHQTILSGDYHSFMVRLTMRVLRHLHHRAP